MAGGSLWRQYSAAPERFVQALGTGVDVSTAVIFPGTHHRYTYSGSPLLQYLAYESRYVDFDTEAIAALADHIAQEVGWRMLLEAREDDISRAEVVLWESNQQRRIPEWIAAELAASRVIYSPETLLSRGFDKALHQGQYMHLDCDLISHFFLHVGWRLDLNLQEISSPLHTYLRYTGPVGVPLHIEPTAFRQTIERDGFVDLSAQEVGEGFFIRERYHQEQGAVRAHPDLIAAAGFYEVVTERDLTDAIVSEVMAGLVMRAWEQGDQERLAVIEDELEAHLPGTRDPNLVSNLFLLYLQRGDDALARGDLDAAAEAAEQAVAMRATWDSLIVHTEPMEEVLLGRLRQQQGHRAEAIAILSAAIGSYAALDPDHPTASSDTHAEALLSMARLWGASVRTYNTLILPVLNYEERVRRAGGDDQRRREAYAMCARALVGVDPQRAAQCREQAQE